MAVPFTALPFLHLTPSPPRSLVPSSPPTPFPSLHPTPPNTNPPSQSQVTSHQPSPFPCLFITFQHSIPLSLPTPVNSRLSSFSLPCTLLHPTPRVPSIHATLALPTLSHNSTALSCNLPQSPLILILHHHSLFHHSHVPSHRPAMPPPCILTFSIQCLHTPPFQYLVPSQESSPFLHYP